MRRVWRARGLLLLLLVSVNGCQTVPQSDRASKSVLSTVTLPEPLDVATPAPLPQPEIIESRGVATNPAWPRDWVNVWVPLESWGRFNGLGKPRQLTSGPEGVFQLDTSNGLMKVKIGSKSARVDGLEYGLGFAPRLINGLPYVHSLDAQKTFQVLLNALFPLPATNRTIVVDPGHGGKDSGTQSSACREWEKHYTLDWARRLQQLLAASGWRVVLTRTHDTDLSLGDRVAVAERVNADLFLSLHFNSGGSNRELTGVETYCLTPTGMPSNLLRGYEDDPRETHPNNLFDDQNLRLASRLHRTVLQATGAADRAVRRARFMAVLRGQHRPAVLIEGGYLSNLAEARKIDTPQYRQSLAEGVAKALEGSNDAPPGIQPSVR
jgi:N-acetylmuramoyl-L-alanine amidase